MTADKKKHEDKKAESDLKLKRYISKALALGKNDDFIIQKLTKLGWPKEYVQDKIKEVGKDEKLQTG